MQLLNGKVDASAIDSSIFHFKEPFYPATASPTDG